MSNFYNDLLAVLRQDERFFTEDGELLRNAVVEASGKMDAKLIKALYENETTRERFFTDVDGIAEVRTGLEIHVVDRGRDDFMTAVPPRNDARQLVDPLKELTAV